MQLGLRAGSLKEAPIKIDSPRARAWSRFVRHRMALAGLIVIALLTVMAIAAPVIAPVGPTKTDLKSALDAPSGEHWLGTDPAGRDVWARVVFAARISLAVGFVSVGIALAISIVLGSLAGYYGGFVDSLIMRIVDIVICVPGLILVLIVVSLTGPSVYNVMFVLGIIGWTGMTRLLRAQILSVRERDYVVAARCLGATGRRVMLRHVLPNSFGPLIVASTFGIGGAILAEAGLSFLGFGVLPPTPSWGNMLIAARSFSRLQENPWFWIPPGMAILLTVLAINFIGDGLRDALDPRQRRV
jgi:peptide/nickel transport system permease protein